MQSRSLGLFCSSYLSFQLDADFFSPRKYWLITQEAVALSRHDWKIVDWDVKPQHKQTNDFFSFYNSVPRPKMPLWFVLYICYEISWRPKGVLGLRGEHT